MARTGGFFVWIAVMMALYSAIHYYFWVRLIRAPVLPQPWHMSLSILLITLALSVPAAIIVARYFGWQNGDALLWPAFAWTGLALFLLLSLLTIDAVQWLALLPHKLQNNPVLQDPQKRLFLSRVLAGGAATLSAGVASYSIYSAVTGPKVKRVAVSLGKWPKSFAGYKIVQLSDLHIGRTIGRSYVEQVVAKTNALNPDLIVITGDLVDGTPQLLQNAAEPLGHLKARHGVYFVPGNHDHYSGVEPWVQWLQQHGIKVLRNQLAQIREQDDQGFELAGVDDSYFNANVGAALAGHDNSREVILLAHQPQEFRAAAKNGVGLQLSGHTHGGQIWPFTFFAGFMFRHVAGLYKVGKTQIYVSRGTGYVGPPMRLGAPSEITEIEISRAG